jgi:Uma2 family endonuclease
MTVLEWELLPEDEPGELIDDRLMEEEVPDFIHEAIVGWLLRIFGAWVIPRGGYVFGSEVKFAVSPRRGRKPDLSVFFSRKGRFPRRGAGRSAPDIIVEVLSAMPQDGRRDRVEKVDDYAAFKVAYYWLVDPEQRSIEILQLGPDGRYVRALGAFEGRLDSVPGCEGLVIDLDALWTEMDEIFAESE